MEEKFYNDGFEDFLKQQVKDQRMFPSDHVWRNIHNKIHGDTNWPALTIAALAFLAAVIAVSVYFSPSPDIFAAPHGSYADTKNNSIRSNRNDLLNPIAKQENNVSSTAPFNQIADIEHAPFTPNKVTNSADKLLESSPIMESRNDEKENDITIPNTNVNFGKVKPADLSSNVNLLDINLSVKRDVAQTAGSEERLSLNRPNVSKVKEPGSVSPNLLAQKDTRLPKKRSVKGSRFDYLVYIAPSSSYRKLLESHTDRSQANNGGPLGLNYVENVNKIVRHLPGTGIEAGVSLGYKINNHFKLKTGLQLNVRQYSIEAFNTPTERATIALFKASGNETIDTYTSYRASNGNAPIQLINRYYEASIPIGVEWKVIGNNDIQFNIAASVQPTYLLNRNAYLISNDYKNYALNPGIMRNWNFNSNLEAFISIKSGDYKWQLGPQFRYQNLPTFIKAYPIREHLIDYGIKLGVSKSIQ